MEGLEHQDFPFALMVDRLGLARDPSRSPVFQVMFVFQHSQVQDTEGLTPFALREHGPRMDLGGLAIESMALELGTAQFDLTLVAAEQEERLALSLEYNVDLFDSATIDRLLDHFQTLLESIVAAPIGRSRLFRSCRRPSGICCSRHGPGSQLLLPRRRNSSRS